MQRVEKFFGHIIAKMFRWMVSWAVVIGAVVTAGFSINTHHLPQGGDLGLIIVVVIVSGLLGLVSALAWELTHIGQVAKFVRNRTQQNVTETQEMPSQHTKQ